MPAGDRKPGQLLECHSCHRVGYRGYVPWGDSGWECSNDRACKKRQGDCLHALDDDGDWEIRVTIYRNGRRVATADTLGDSFQFASYMATTKLETREVDMHQPRPRKAKGDR